MGFSVLFYPLLLTTIWLESYLDGLLHKLLFGLILWRFREARFNPETQSLE